MSVASGDFEASSEVFSAARKQFFASISETEQASFSECSSQDEFLDDIRKLEVISKQKRRGTKFLKQINKLSDGLNQYFMVIEIIISSHPEYAAIAWGVFRLVLQVSYTSSIKRFPSRLTSFVAG
jgi:hypothetical protein